MGKSKEMFMQLREEESSLQLADVDRLINQTKSNMSQAVDKLVAKVNDGFLDPIDTLIYAKKGVELFGQLEKIVRPIAEDAIRLQKGERYSKYNSEITQKETGVKYDFSTCNDPEWEALKAAAEKADARLKEREKFLKAITKPINSFDEETGETFTINPPVKSGKLGIALSIK